MWVVERYILYNHLYAYSLLINEIHTMAKLNFTWSEYRWVEQRKCVDDTVFTAGECEPPDEWNNELCVHSVTFTEVENKLPNDWLT